MGHEHERFLQKTQSLTCVHDVSCLICWPQSSSRGGTIESVGLKSSNYLNWVGQRLFPLRPRKFRGRTEGSGVCSEAKEAACPVG